MCLVDVCPNFVCDRCFSFKMVETFVSGCDFIGMAEEHLLHKIETSRIQIQRHRPHTAPDIIVSQVIFSSNIRLDILLCVLHIDKHTPGGKCQCLVVPSL